MLFNRLCGTCRELAFSGALPFGGCCIGVGHGVLAQAKRGGVRRDVLLSGTRHLPQVMQAALLTEFDRIANSLR